jgi:alpha-glucosidase/alpha-D-xyloside xylohydrolase
MRCTHVCVLVTALLLTVAIPANAQEITAAGQPAQLDVRPAGERAVRITLKPRSFTPDFPVNPALATRSWPAPALSLREVSRSVDREIAGLSVEVRGEPLTVRIKDDRGRQIQEIVFNPDGSFSFALDENPVLGMGGGGPRPERDTPWRQQPVQYDRRGQLDTMQPRWQSDMYGSRNPVPMLVGTAGWALFVGAPWGQVDLRKPDRGVFLPWVPTQQDKEPQDRGNQQQANGKGLPPPDAVVPGLVDLFIFDAKDPLVMMRDFSRLTGPAAMPPRWALGYMQSHRTLEDDKQMVGIVDMFRQKRIPIDAVIYLGTGFAPRGWNREQPSFEFSPEVFTRDPLEVLRDLHARNVKVVVHMVPFDRDQLPTLHGTIPAARGETKDTSHIESYWQQHVPLVRAGIDAFWPDEGDWFNLYERIKRHQLYYQGHLATTPNRRPWSLQRNGYPGIAQWGGWVWSGDTESSWKTLEAQIAVGLNYSLSIGPYWGSDIGGFYPNNELTGELYVRWHQFAAFCGSFRSHGRTWWTRLPWGWGSSNMGPREYNNRNTPIPPDDRRNILESELNNPAIEPIAKKYSELRYQLLPYTYTLAWEARALGLPLMRAMWLHYPDDPQSRVLGNQYLWGRDLLIAPIYTKGATSRDVYLPKGDWYDWWTSKRIEGGRTITRPIDLETMPIYVRAGSILPVDPLRQYASQPIADPTSLRIYRGASGEFMLYEDDGLSQEYLSGRGSWIRIQWNDQERRIIIEPAPPEGATNVVRQRIFRVEMLPEGTVVEIRYVGTRVEGRF